MGGLHARRFAHKKNGMPAAQSCPRSRAVELDYFDCFNITAKTATQATKSRISENEKSKLKLCATISGENSESHCTDIASLLFRNPPGKAGFVLPAILGRYPRGLAPRFSIVKNSEESARFLAGREAMQQS